MATNARHKEIALAAGFRKINSPKSSPICLTPIMKSSKSRKEAEYSQRVGEGSVCFYDSSRCLKTPAVRLGGRWAGAASGVKARPLVRSQRQGRSSTPSPFVAMCHALAISRVFPAISRVVRLPHVEPRRSWPDDVPGASDRMPQGCVIL